MLLANKDSISDDFSNFIDSMANICNASKKDVLEVMFKNFNLTEIYLASDITNFMKRYEIARCSSDILRAHKPVDPQNINVEIQKIKSIVKGTYDYARVI